MGDGISPLTLPPGVAHILWFALMLGLGLGLAATGRQFKDRGGLRST